MCEFGAIMINFASLSKRALATLQVLDTMWTNLPVSGVVCSGYHICPRSGSLRRYLPIAGVAVHRLG